VSGARCGGILWKSQLQLLGRQRQEAMLETPYEKQNKKQKEWARGIAEVFECLPTMSVALGSISSTEKKNTEWRQLKDFLLKGRNIA
jgi:hypothetical protein